MNELASMPNVFDKNFTSSAMSSKIQAKHSLRFSNPARAILNGEELDLFELAWLAGIQLDPKVFKIILDLLQLNVSPTAIVEMLKGMSSQVKLKDVATVTMASQQECSISQLPKPKLMKR